MNAIKHYLQFKDFTREEYAYLFERTGWIKDKFKRYEPHHPLFDRTLVMIFEKASTRTTDGDGGDEGSEVSCHT